MSLHLKLLLVTAFWGVTPTVGRVLAHYHAPFVVVAGRFVIAAIFLLWFTALARQFVRIPRRLWWRLLVLGVSGIYLHNGLMFKGLEYTSATTASIILALVAIQVVILDFLFYRRRPDGFAMLGVGLAFCGTAFVITDGQLFEMAEFAVGRGEVLIFLSGLAWAVYSVIGREVLEEYPPLVISTYATLVGLIFLLPALAHQPELTIAVYSDPLAVGCLVVLGFLGTALGFLWYYEAVSEMGTVETSVYINLVPVFGVLSAAVFLDEQVNSAALVGGGMVLAGVMLANRPWANSPSAESD